MLNKTVISMIDESNTIQIIVTENDRTHDQETKCVDQIIILSAVIHVMHKSI